jgi:hypothetical protein
MIENGSTSRHFLTGYVHDTREQLGYSLETANCACSQGFFAAEADNDDHAAI